MGMLWLQEESLKGNLGVKNGTSLGKNGEGRAGENQLSHFGNRVWQSKRGTQLSPKILEEAEDRLYIGVVTEPVPITGGVKRNTARAEARKADRNLHLWGRRSDVAMTGQRALGSPPWCGTHSRQGPCMPG